jgi:hypothetical protein
MPDKQYFYQAIAIIRGQLKLDGPHPILTIGDWDYPAYASKVVRWQRAMLGLSRRER